MPKRRNSVKPTAKTTTRHELINPPRRSQRLIGKGLQDLRSEIPETTKSCAQKASKEVGKFDEKSLTCAIPDLGNRRSPRLSGRLEENLGLRRSPRLSVIKNSNEVVRKSNDNKSKKTKKGKVEVRSRDEIARRMERKTETCVNCSVVVGLEAVKRIDLCRKNQENRFIKKRKREEEGNNGSFKGWTKEQDMALQRAYLVAKPTPNFWKQVSKLVPGKSAQDCFDRVHSEHRTPDQQLPRSRARRMTSSPLGHFSLSAGKLLSPSRMKVKGLNGSKPTRRIAHKTVRQLLQKHSRLDQNHQADLFSILEPNVNPSRQDSQVGNIISTPKCLQEKQGLFQQCNDRCSSGQKKALSRLGNLCGMNLVSPPVLKLVKNRALHEKYIDQLHVREATRKRACSRAGKGKSFQINIQKAEVLRAAKNALVSDARDAINKLQHLKTNANDESSDVSDDNYVDSDDECDGLCCFKNAKM